MADGDPWHFGRPDLARRTLTLLANGPARALTLFAPRRTGKTEFLMKDLGPLAETEGHRAIYVSFWQEPLAPLAALLHALETDLKRGGIGERLLRTGRALAPKLKLSMPMVGQAEVDLSTLAGKPPSDLLLHLDDLLGRVSTGIKPTILMLDEVQELARSQDNEALVAALRTSLDKRSDHLRTVFTGSSREGLASMFAARQAPFFHFATPIDLPPLGEPFVNHILRTMAGCCRTQAAAATNVRGLQGPSWQPVLLPYGGGSDALESESGRQRRRRGRPRSGRGGARPSPHLAFANALAASGRKDAARARQAFQPGFSERHRG